MLGFTSVYGFALLCLTEKAEPTHHMAYRDQATYTWTYGSKWARPSVPLSMVVVASSAALAIMVCKELASPYLIVVWWSYTQKWYKSWSVLNLIFFIIPQIYTLLSIKLILGSHSKLNFARFARSYFEQCLVCCCCRQLQQKSSERKIINIGCPGAWPAFRFR